MAAKTIMEKIIEAQKAGSQGSIMSRILKDEAVRQAYSQTLPQYTPPAVQKVTRTASNTAGAVVLPIFTGPAASAAQTVSQAKEPLLNPAQTAELNDFGDAITSVEKTDPLDYLRQEAKKSEEKAVSALGTVVPRTVDFDNDVKSLYGQLEQLKQNAPDKMSYSSLDEYDRDRSAWVSKVKDVQAEIGAKTQPQTSSQIQIPGYSSQTTTPEIANPFLYTAMQFGAGTMSTPLSIQSGASTMLSDLFTGRKTSDDFWKISQYFTEHPEQEKLGMTETEAVFNRGGVNDLSLAGKIGVSPRSLSLYRQSNQNDSVAQFINDEVGATTPDWYKSTLGQSLYSIGAQVVPMIMTMGASSAATVGSDSFLGALMGGEKTSRALVNLVKPNATTALMGVSSAGNKYNQLAKEYGSNPLNVVNAMATGYAEALTENLGGFTDAQSFVRRFSGNSFKSNFVKYLASMAEEGMEEVVNVPLEGIADKTTVDPNKPWAGSGGVFDLEAMVESGVQGALVSAIMGGSAFISSTVNHVRQTHRIKAGVEVLTGIAKTSLPEEMRPNPINPQTATMEDFNHYAEQVQSAIDTLKEQALSAAWDTGKTAVNTDLAGHTPQEQRTILEYQNAVDPALIDYIKTVQENPENRYLNFEIKPVSARETAAIKNLAGIDVTGYRHNIKPSAVEHILKRHGKNGQADHSMANVEDIARIPYVLENYDRVSLGKGKDYAFVNGDRSPSQKVIFEKAIDGTFYVVEAVPDSKAKKLQVVTAYINKKGAGQVLNTTKSPSADVQNAHASAPEAYQVPNADKNPPRPTSKIEPELASAPIIPSSAQKSNNASGKSSPIIPGLMQTAERGGRISWRDTEKDAVSNAAAAFEEKWGIRTRVMKPDAETGAAAFLQGGTVVLNAERVNTYAGAVGKIAHEVTHIAEGSRSWSELKKAAAEYYRAIDPSLKPSELREAVRERYKGVAELDGNQAAAEVVAGFMEDICSRSDAVGERASRLLLEQSPNAFQRVMQFLKDKVQSLKAYIPVGTGLSKQQRYELQATQKGLRNLEKALKDYRKGKVELDRTANIKYSLDIPFSEAAKRIENDTLKRSENPFVLVSENTPKIFLTEKIGAQNRPVIISYESLYLAVRNSGELRGHYHSIGSNLISKLPEILNDPELILRLENGRLNAIVELPTSKGGRSVVSIEMEAIKDINKSYKAYNLIVTVFGAKENYINNLLSSPNNTVVYKKGDSPQVNPRLNKLSGIVNEESPNTTLSQDHGSVNISIPENSKNDTSYSYGEGSFTDYYLQYKAKKYGTIPRGENAYRDVSVPRQTSEGTRTRQTVRTILEAESTPDSAGEAIREDVANEAYAYVPIEDQEAQSYAERTIQNRGWSGALDRWEAVVNGTEFATKDTIVLAETLMMEAGRTGDVQLFQKLAAEISTEATRAGQTVQAIRLIKKLTPAGQLYYVQKSVDVMQKDLNRRMKNKAPSLEIDPELGRKLLEAKTAEEIDAAAQEIYRNVAEQTPATWQEKWDAWRYMSMLLNPRTHIRNLLGNTVFVPAKAMKDAAAMGLEQLLVKPEERTQAILTKADRPLREFAEENFEEMKEILTGGGKMNPTSQINELRPVFKTKWLEAARKFNDSALEAEDLFFLKRVYVNSMAKAIKARKLDVDFLKSGTREATAQLRRLESTAIREAKEATYQDASRVASALNRFKNTNRVTNVIGNALFAFTKTPINVLKRGVEYSPAGLIKGVVDMTYGVKSGKKTAAEAVNSFCKGLSGVGITLLGYWLSSMGLLVAGGSDDRKEKGFESLQGEKTYSLKIGDVYYTIDWMAPVALPLFVGAEMQKMSEGEGFSVANIADSMTKISEPMFNLSMLDGINGAFKAVAYSDGSYLTDFAVEAAIDYLTQGLPTLGGQIARTIDPTARNSYYIDKNSPIPTAVQEFLNAAQAKLPGLSYLLSPKVDQWGRTSGKGNVLIRAFENFISPGYISTRNETPVDKEIAEIYRETGDASILPATASKSFMVDGESLRLSAGEYAEYAQERGQRSYQYINELLSSPNYQKLDPDEKAEVIAQMYQAANAEAKQEVSRDYDLPSTVIKAYEAKKQAGILYGEYYLWKLSLDSTPNQQEVIDALNRTSLTRAQKRFLFAQRFPNAKQKPFG